MRSGKISVGVGALSGFATVILLGAVSIQYGFESNLWLRFPEQIRRIPLIQGNVLPLLIGELVSGLVTGFLYRGNSRRALVLGYLAGIGVYLPIFILTWLFAIGFAIALILAEGASINYGGGVALLLLVSTTVGTVSSFVLVMVISILAAVTSGVATVIRTNG